MTEIFGSTNSIIKRMERTIYRKWSEGTRERGDDREEWRKQGGMVVRNLLRIIKKKLLFIYQLCSLGTLEWKYRGKIFEL